LYIGFRLIAPEGFRGVFAAIASGGIAFAFTGFRHAIELAAETENPQRAIPLAIIGSITCCFFLYVILQLVFLVSVEPSAIQHGWQHISFSGDVGPFLGIATLLGLGWLVVLLYTTAVVSPLGAALVYVTSTSRIVYAMAENGYFPKIFTKLNSNSVPAWSIGFNFAVGMLMFLPFPGWQAMVSFLVSAVVVSYGMGPVSLICLRLQLPDKKRPFKLRGGITIATLSFYLCNLIAYWSGWDTIKKLMIAMLIGVVIFIVFNRKRKEMDFQSSLWLMPYFIGLALISYLGTFGGGVGVIPFGLDFLIIGLFSLAILALAVVFRLPSKRTLSYISQVTM